MLVRFAIVWALLHIGLLIREIKQYRESKQWGWRWWLKYHTCALTQFVLFADRIFIVAAIIYWLINGSL